MTPISLSPINKLGTFSGKNINKESKDAENFEVISNSKMKRRFKFSEKECRSYQDVSHLSSIDSINQMKEQLKCLSDTLKMDIKSFRESTNYDQLNKINCISSKKKLTIFKNQIK